MFTATFWMGDVALVEAHKNVPLVSNHRRTAPNLRLSQSVDPVGMRFLLRLPSNKFSRRPGCHQILFFAEQWNRTSTAETGPSDSLQK